MAAKRPKDLKQHKPPRPGLGLNINPVLQHEIIGLALLAFAGLVLLTLLGVTPGSVTNTLGALLKMLFGWGAYALPVVAVGISIPFLRGGETNGVKVVWGRVFTAEVLFALLLA